MAQFEALLVVVALCSLVVICFFPAMTYLRWAALLSLILAFALHAHFETLRLGMAGTYVVAAVVLLLLLFPSLLKYKLLLPGATLFLVLLLWSIASATIIPPLLAPAPTGPFLAGRLTPEFTVLEPPGAEYRRPAVEIWYPVDQQQSGMPLAYERRFRRGGISGAPIASASPHKFPMVLYFSGGSGTGFDGINVVRELVSWGYIVAAVSYPVSLPDLDPQDEIKRQADFERDLFNFTSTRTFAETLAPIDNRIRERALDAAHVVDQITTLSQDSAVLQISSRLETDKIGIMGFSFGGSIAAEAKKLDSRFKAALNLDGWHFGSSVDGVPWPYFLVVSGESFDLYEKARATNIASEDYAAALTLRDFEKPIISMRVRGGYILSIPGANHLNFADCAFSGSIFRNSPCAGKTDKYRVFSIMSKYTVGFFETHLKDRMNSREDSAMLAGISSEARFENWPPATDVINAKAQANLP